MPCVLCVYVGSIASIYRRFELESVEVAEVYTLCINAHSLTHSHTIYTHRQILCGRTRGNARTYSLARQYQVAGGNQR